MINILIVDDNPDFSNRVRDFLIDIRGIDIIGEASDGEEAISQARALEPDLVLMDVRMAGMNGLTATQQLKDEHPQMAIIILSTYDLHEYREAARIRGASGYVVKMNMADELIPAIQQALEEQGKWTE